MKKALTILTLLLVLVMTTASLAAAPDFNNKNVTFICPWDAGGSSDAISRQIAELFAKMTGARTAVENRGGAGGTIATTEFKAAPADGTSICLEAIGVFTLQPFVREVQYSIDDFIPVVALSEEPIVMLAHKNADISSVEDLKAKDSVLYGFSGAGSLMELSQKKLLKDLGVDAVGIPYDGSSSALSAVLGEHVDVIVTHPGESLQYIESGDLKAVGVFNAERMVGATLEDIPTFKEQGYDTTMSVWKFFIVPKATDPAIVDYLVETLNACTSSPEYLEFCEKLQLQPLTLTPEQMIERINNEAEVNKLLLEADKPAA